MAKINNRDRNKNFLSKDFTSFRSGIQEYIENYYSDKISDFSESGLPGMFVDMAAYIGDNMSYYLDFQFNELDLETAVDIKNIQKHMKSLGVKPRGPSPARAEIVVSLIIPARLDVNNEYVPDPDYIPILRSGTTVVSSTGVSFELIEDLDFNKKNENDAYLFSFRMNPDEIDSNGNPLSFIVERKGTFISGKTINEVVNIDPIFQPFRRISLSNINVNEIISVFDSNNNQYYEVDNLSQDVVFVAIPNYGYDSKFVKDTLELRPAARRFVTERDIETGVITLVFGSGNENEFENDLMPSPEEIAIEMHGKRNFTNFSIDTNNILKTDTLGISPYNTSLTINYRTGGGLNHNVKPGTINTISRFTLDFKSSVPVSIRTKVRNSIQVSNPEAAFGGENQPTIEELRFIGINSRSMQSRIVSKEDLIARVYTMPSSLGRVFRASAISNLDNPFSASLYILTRNADGLLISPTDTMKKNIKTFLNKFRLVSDSIDILDSPVVNLKIEYIVQVDPLYNKDSVIRTINSKISSFMQIESFQIGTPIVITDIEQLIFSVSGVTSIVEVKIKNVSGKINNNQYSNFSYPIDQNTVNKIVYPPDGGIFELRYPDFNIIGLARG
tara:strand:- start:6568 stop:8412 length:1845 start_codon:yes stop_codon:yes gene_type:complete